MPVDAVVQMLFSNTATCILVNYVAGWELPFDIKSPTVLIIALTITEPIASLLSKGNLSSLIWKKTFGRMTRHLIAKTCLILTFVNNLMILTWDQNDKNLR